jgi:hypothetical protein
MSYIAVLMDWMGWGIVMLLPQATYSGCEHLFKKSVDKLEEKIEE